MLVAHEVGRRLGAMRQARGAGNEDKNDDAFIVSGVLGLLALLMAFSFSMSLNRFEERRDLMLAEASALGYLALLTEAIAPADGAPIRAMLRRYGKSRLTVVMLTDGPSRSQAAADADGLRGMLGARVAAGIRVQEGRPTAVALAQAFDAVEDTAVRREAMTAAHLPERVLWLLLTYCITSAAMLGFSLALARQSRRAASSTFYLLLSLAFATMLDLDRPRSGAIVIPQQPFIEAIQALPRM